MNESEFVQRWAGRPLTERSAAQSHFRDLCALLGVPAPTDDRETDHEYCYEARTEIRASRAAISEDDPHLFGKIVRSEGRGFCDCELDNYAKYAQKTYNTWLRELSTGTSFRKRSQFGGSSKT